MSQVDRAPTERAQEMDHRCTENCLVTWDKDAKKVSSTQPTDFTRHHTPKCQSTMVCPVSDKGDSRAGVSSRDEAWKNLQDLESVLGSAGRNRALARSTERRRLRAQSVGVQNICIDFYTLTVHPLTTEELQRHQPH